MSIAQIAVGLAGFTGVASVLDTRRSAAHSRVQSERLRGMIETALLSAGAALLPIVIVDTGAEEAIAWRLSAALALAAIGPALGFGIRRAVRANREVGQSPRSMAAWRILTAGLAAFVTLALLACLVGIDAGRAAYLASLYALLVFSGILFHRFFLAGREATRD